MNEPCDDVVGKPLATPADVNRYAMLLEARAGMLRAEQLGVAARRALRRAAVAAIACLCALFFTCGFACRALFVTLNRSFP